MGLETQEDREHNSLSIEISEYKTLELAISEIIIPFGEVLKASNVPDIYSGYEKIPFEKRNPIYRSILREEFADAIQTGQNLK